MPVRVATYTHVATRRDRSELRRRHRRLAAAVARRPGAMLVGQYEDAGPTPPLGRPGLARLVADARASCFDAVVVEHLGRLAPNTEDAAARRRGARHVPRSGPPTRKRPPPTHRCGDCGSDRQAHRRLESNFHGISQVPDGAGETRRSSPFSRFSEKNLHVDSIR